MNYDASVPQPAAGSSSRTRPYQQDTSQITPGSPPPYSPEPPESTPNSPFLVKRSSSTPHLNSPPLLGATISPYPRSQANSRRPSSSALFAHPLPRSRASYTREETDDDADTVTSGDDAVVYRSPQPTIAGSLRERLFGNGQPHHHNERRRMISTTRGVRGAGETEPEGEDAVSDISTKSVQ